MNNSLALTNPLHIMAFLTTTSNTTSATGTTAAAAASSAASSPAVSRSNSGVFRLYAPGQQQAAFEAASSNSNGATEYSRPDFVLRGPTSKKTTE